MRHRFFLVFIILFLSLLIHSNAQTFESKSIFQQLTSKDGLQNNNVYTIVQDDYGFMWFGTENGLHRYDGISFTLFEHDPLTPTSIAGNLIFKIIKDKNYQLWICSNTGFDKYDPIKNIFIHIPIQETTNTGIFLNYNLYCPTAFVHSDGSIYVSEGYKGIFKVNTHTNQLEKVVLKNSLGQDIALGIVTTICETEDGNMWFGTKNDGLYQVETASLTAHKYFQINASIHSRIFFDILKDSQGRLFIATDKGIYLYNQQRKIFMFIDSRSTFSITETSSGDVWFGTNNDGILVLKKRQQALVHIEANENSLTALSSNNIRAIYEDVQHIIWIGTFKGGINYILKNNHAVFNTIKRNATSSNTLSYNSVDGILQDRSGNLWMGTDGGGLNFLNTKTNQFKLYNGSGLRASYKPLKSALTIFEDSEGTIWTGGYLEGLCKLDKKRNVFYRYENIPSDTTSIGSNDVRCIFEDSKHNFWIATNGGGLNLFDKKTYTFKRFTPQSIESMRIASDYCLTIFEDKQQRLWIGTYEGISILNKDRTQVKNYRKEDRSHSLSSNWIYCIYQDHAGRVWLGTDYGLNLFDDKTGACTVYLKKDGLPNNVIAGILEDEHGFLWISTNGGLSKFDPDKKKFSNFNIEDGLQGNHFNVSAAFKSVNGTLYFGGTKGLTYFNPNNIIVNKTPPPLYITDIRSTDSTLYVFDSLSHTQPNKVSIDYKDAVMLIFNFVALNFISSSKNKYSYFLEGFDTDWHNTNNDPSATYTNLDPGTYVFRVKASNNDGIWNTDGTSIVVVVLPPWYKTWWFRVFLVVFICAIIISVYLIRVHSIKQQNIFLQKEVDSRTLKLKETNEELIKKKTDLEKLNQMKNRFFTIIGHDLKNPVTALTMLTDLFEEEFIDTASPHQKQFITHISTASKEIRDLVLNLFEWAKTQANSIHIDKKSIQIVKSFTTVLELLSLQIKQKQLNVTVNIEKDIFIEADKNMFETIVRNIISNSIKYCNRNGRIDLKAFSTNEWVTISISDSGIGMKPDVAEHIFELDKQVSVPGTEGESGTGLGMIICKEFVSLNQGEIIVESELGVGTIFYLKFAKSQSIEFYKNSTVEEDTAAINLLYKQEIVLDENKKTETQSLVKCVAEFDVTIPTVVVAEDSDELRLAIKKVLAGSFNVLAIENGKIALKIINKILPDLIISDVLMPELDGIELSKKLKKEFNTCHIPIILLTSLNEDEDKIKGIESGADDYIIKPFNAKMLLSKAISLIESRKILQRKFVSDIQSVPSEIAITSMDETFIQEAIAVIELHMEDSEFNVEIFSAAMHVSQSSLLRKLKGITGQSPNQFIRSIRLKRAAQLLQLSNFNVNEVCYKVGFNDVKYFRQCYQKQFGINPGESIKDSDK